MNSFASLGMISVCLVTLAECWGPLKQAAAHQHGPVPRLPITAEIENQRERLKSAEVEERRDALVHLSALHHPAAARLAAKALSDPAPIVRATATQAVLSLPPDEAASLLIPLLTDKEEFVRQEAAYALGRTHSNKATGALSERVLNDKKDSVRAAAALALGNIADQAAAVPLLRILQPNDDVLRSRQHKRDNPFLIRAVVHSLGEIRSRSAVPTLIAMLEGQDWPDDVKRQVAISLGMIGDASAESALRSASRASDPYLSMAASEALKRMKRS